MRILFSTAILLVIFKLLLPSTLAFFGKAEVFFVNTIGLPFNSGTIISALIIITIFYYSLKFTREKNLVNFEYWNFSNFICINWFFFMDNDSYSSKCKHCY